MFETLEPPEQTVARQWPLLMYTIYATGGGVFLIFGIRRHGFSQPFRLVVGAAMFVLSLTWLVMTVRTNQPLSNRNFGRRNMILILLTMAHEIYGLLM